MPTALELTRKEWRKYLRSAAKRPPFPALSEDERKERDLLKARAKQAAKELKERFGVDRVVLFGSLAQTHWSSSTSDVDLAVEGLRPQDYWQALKVVEEIIADRNVDLVETETAPESLKSSIDKYGIEL